MEEIVSRFDKTTPDRHSQAGGTQQAHPGRGHRLLAAATAIAVIVSGLNACVQIVKIAVEHPQASPHPKVE